MATLRYEYFEWLYSKIEPDNGSYRKLCYELYKKNFRWFIQNDDNRCADGVTLRTIFIKEFNLNERDRDVKRLLRRNCTVLEVMVALAKRMNDVMYDLRDEVDHTCSWFWILAGNLKLDKYDDTCDPEPDQFTPVIEAEINEILENMLDRTYDRSGNGSMFPLRKCNEDMTRVEIWYQMMKYLDENYS